MKRIVLKNLEIENFKGIAHKAIDFTQKTDIFGQNASGKTSIFDAFTWLLFNKDSSGSEKFQVRPLDVNGETIHNVEISVKALLSIDGEDVELHKTQKEKWVKKRGSETADLQGNENVYEIDGYPKAEKEYKAYISELVDEDLFKMLTNPQYFVNLPWKDQRNILMEFVADLNDVEIAEKDPKFAPLVSEIKKAPSLDDIKKKYSKAKSEWDAQLKEIPARIDEVSKMKCDVDVAEQELAKVDLERRISEIEGQMKSSNNIIFDLEQKKFELQFEINNCKRKANEDITHKRRELSDKEYEAQRTLEDVQNKIRSFERDISDKKQQIESLETEKAELGKRYTEEVKREFTGTLDFDESKWVFDESSTVCSLCGQTLPDDKIKASRTEFEDKKAKAKADAEQKLKADKENFESYKKNEVERIKTLGFEKKEQIEKQKSYLEKLESELPRLKDSEAATMKQKNDLQKQLDELPTEADLSGNEEYQALIQKDADYQKQIDAVKSNEVDTTELDKQKAELESQLKEVNSLIAKAGQNVEIDERIASLEEEQREISQKVADQEKLLFLLDEFIKEKMKLISESINKHFELVNFRLFKMQINGGLTETCECTFNGIPYSSLNSAAKIQCGLDIIRSLSALYQISCCVFVDNRESCTLIPRMDCQVISMYVAPECKELVIKND